MLHLGTPSFYGAVVQGLDQCDVILMEGVGGRRTKLITLAYRIAGRLRREGLVDQRQGMNLDGIRSRLVTPDATGAEFAASWQHVSPGTRWLVYLLAPVFGVYLAIAGPRAVLGAEIALDDLPSRDDSLAPQQIQAVLDAVTDDRDLKLWEALWAAADSGFGVDSVGVCYGAGHVAAAVKFLRSELGYRISDARWVAAW
jgi:hypothetical protein